MVIWLVFKDIIDLFKMKCKRYVDYMFWRLSYLKEIRVSS